MIKLAMRDVLPARQVSAGEMFELLGLGQHHRADLVCRFIAQRWKVLNERPPHDFP